MHSTVSVADLVEGRKGVQAPLFWFKKICRRKKSPQGKQTPPPQPSTLLAQGLDLPPSLNVFFVNNINDSAFRKQS